MPTIGDTTKPNRAETCYFASSEVNQVSQALTMPEAGKITRLGAWLASVGSSTSARLCIWSSAGVLLGYTPALTISARPWAAGNVDRYEADLDVPVELDASVGFRVGFSRNPNGAHQITGQSAGGSHSENKRTTWPGDVTTAGVDHGFGHYTFGGYVANYDIISGAWVRRGGIWVRAEGVFVRRSGVWVAADAVQVRRSGAWVDAD